MQKHLKRYDNLGYYKCWEFYIIPFYALVQIFVGGIDGSSVSEESLRQVFGPYGEIIYVKIPVGKRCAFVQFSSRFLLISLTICFLV